MELCVSSPYRNALNFSGEIEYRLIGSDGDFFPYFPL